MWKMCKFCWESCRHQSDCPLLAADSQKAVEEWNRGYREALKMLEGEGNTYYKAGRNRGFWARDERDEW